MGAALQSTCDSASTKETETKTKTKTQETTTVDADFETISTDNLREGDEIKAIIKLAESNEAKENEYGAFFENAEIIIRLSEQ